MRLEAPVLMRTKTPVGTTKKVTPVAAYTPGHLLEDVGDPLRRISRPGQGHPEMPEEVEDGLRRRRGHRLRFRVGRATQRSQAPTRNPREVRPRVPDRRPATLDRRAG
jgi:hypothetical protein